jgi:hypothetical protein
MSARRNAAGNKHGQAIGFIDYFWCQRISADGSSMGASVVLPIDQARSIAFLGAPIPQANILSLELLLQLVIFRVILTSANSGQG